jgi:hypothetical protein
MRLPKNKGKGSGEKARRQANARKAANQRNYAARASQPSPDGTSGAGPAPGDENVSPPTQRARFMRPAVAVAAVAGLLFFGLLLGFAL